MAETTKIQWTDSTFNPWRGCQRVSPGCLNCYAEKMSHRNPLVLGEWGPQGTRVLAAESYWKQPLAWTRKAQQEGVPHRVFCCSLADVFEDWPGHMTDNNGCPLWFDMMTGEIHAAHQANAGFGPYTMREARHRLWRLIETTPHLTWQLLTKRPENMRRLAPRSWAQGWPVNVLAMTSVENQEYADRRIPELLRVPAQVRGLSVEPLLGPVDLAAVKMGCAWNALSCACSAPCEHEKIAWVIIGGESGPHARPCHIEWVRDLVRQCREAGVACFVKQLGSRPYFAEQYTDSTHYPKDHKGGDPAEWPDDLRVREMPDSLAMRR